MLQEPREVNAAFRAKRKTSANGEAKGGEKKKIKVCLFFFPLLALREKMPRSPRLAHKAPVMQATEL